MKTMRWAAVAALSVTVVAAAWAADASGKWNWKQRRGQNEVTQNAEFKQDGEKLTGFVLGGPNGDVKTEIKEGTVKGSDVSFVVERERNGQTFKMTFKGKIDGDTIKGNRIFNRNGQDMMQEWVAMRTK